MDVQVGLGQERQVTHGTSIAHDADPLGGGPGGPAAYGWWHFGLGGFGEIRLLLPVNGLNNPILAGAPHRFIGWLDE
ncbi:hypothetical protein GCM10023191_009510 [Actinoallomurus oryzae]|uniref:Uncharacterized protein n=1 Tax=Actinoallomurus oryzae TaxID=502180 RepID=A0ABP8PEL0_9ACTN